ncbi:DUF4333 domain-containing protein [Nocardia farcinica]
MKASRVAGLIAFACLAAAGCSVQIGNDTPSVAEADLERSVKETLTQQVGQEPDTIDCPGDLEGEVGNTMRCTLTAGGDTLGLTVTVTSVQDETVNYDVQVDPA